MSNNIPHLHHVTAEEIEKHNHIKMDFEEPKFKNTTDLILYYHPYNFYSQKVMFVLYEKNIDFTPYAVDLSNGEQFSSWFLEKNPKADVPVLQDGTFIIPDSNQIINYIENKYQGGAFTRLQPRDLNSKEAIRMQFYDRLLSQIPIGALSLGSFIHDDLKLTPKPPFIGPIRKTCLKNNDKVYEILKESIDRVEINKTALLRKLDVQERRRRLVCSRVEFQKLLDVAHKVLCYIEDDIKENPQREWLITSEFTLVDITFGLLLHRLYQLGFENFYWSYGKLPHIESFFLRFKKRSAYHRLMPNNLEILKDIWQKTPANYKIGAGAGVIGMAMFAALAHK